MSGYRAMASLLLAIDEGARGGEAIARSLANRRSWPVRPDGERVELLTFRDGVLGPASWALGFELVPKLPPEPEEEEEEEDGEDGPGPREGAVPPEGTPRILEESADFDPFSRGR